MGGVGGHVRGGKVDAAARRLSPPPSTARPQEEPAEFPRAGFLGVGQGACYWHGVGGFRRSIIIIIIIIPTFFPRPLCGPGARACAARSLRAIPHAISRCLVLIWQLAWVADKWVSILACLVFALWRSGWGAF